MIIVGDEEPYLGPDEEPADDDEEPYPGPPEESPPFWPPLPDGCPPDAAAPANGTFYRLLRRRASDWQTSHMEFNYSGPREGVKQCEWQSISIFADVADVRKLRMEVSKFKNARIASFGMIESMGVVEANRSDSSHHSWWPADNFDPPPPHAVLEEGHGG